MSTHYLTRPDGSRYRVHRAPAAHIMGGWDGTDGILVTATHDVAVASQVVLSHQPARDYASDSLPWFGPGTRPAAWDVDQWLIDHLADSRLGWGRVIPNDPGWDYAWHIDERTGPRTFPFVRWSW